MGYCSEGASACQRTGLVSAKFQDKAQDQCKNQTNENLDSEVLGRCTYIHSRGYSWFSNIGAMIVFGVIASKRVKDADNFATARSSYGSLLLSLAFASTAANGATFLGVSGLTYTHATSVL